MTDDFCAWWISIYFRLRRDTLCTSERKVSFIMFKSAFFREDLFVSYWKFHIELTHDVRFEDRAWLHELVLFQYPMSKGAEQRSSWSEFRFLAPNGSKWVANLLANYERVVVTYFLAYDILIRSRGRSHVVRWSVVGLCRMYGAQ